jgi:DNA-directed RNA polymerase specialized sigma24 family protein
MAPDPAVPSPEPEDLVAQALDPGVSTEDRSAALAALESFVRVVAGQCARRLIADEQVRQDLIDQSFGFVEERLHQYDPGQGPFRPWLNAVLTHFGRDLRRRWQRHARRYRPLPAREPGQADRPGGSVEEALAGLAEGFALMRADLDACPWPAGRAVDYYAVLLVFLRVEMVASYRRAGAEPVPGDAADRAAEWLPWRAAEEARCFRAGLPPLAELWRRLASRLDGPVGLQVVLDTLNDPPPACGLVGYNTLAQWCFRARTLARDQLGPEAWQEHGFARLLCPCHAEAP